MHAFRTCLREPIPEIEEAAHYLDEAVSAHLSKNFALADDLIRRAHMPEIREWVESIWGKNTGFLPKHGGIGSIEKQLRVKERMPTPVQKAELLLFGFRLTQPVFTRLANLLQNIRYASMTANTRHACVTPK
jgi:hypothetical protein